MSLIFAATGASALAPQALSFDPRLETLEWRQGSELPLRTAVGSSLTVIFGPGEAIQSVLVGDPGAVSVNVAPQADSIALHLRRKPINEMIEVHTQLRDYRFRLVVGPINDVVYTVRFSIAPPGSTLSEAALPPAAASNVYAMKGETSLRPLRVSDDGQRTYIEWGPDQPLPAVFAINTLGEEETVDSYMRQGVMVIDRVYPRLIFRVGKHSAQAYRLAPAKSKPK